MTKQSIPWTTSSGCVYNAQIDAIHVLQTNATTNIDVKATLAVVSEAESIWFATNAAALLAGYDSTHQNCIWNSTPRPAHEEAWGQPASPESSPTLQPTSARAGLILRIHLDGDQFRISALTSEGDLVPIAGTPADATGLHYLGNTLTNGHLP